MKIEKKCVLCRIDLADSAEHFYKSSILAKEIEENKIKNIKIKGISLNSNYKKLYPIQGADSRFVKYEKNICKNCNGNISQNADKTIDLIVNDRSTVLTPISKLVDSFGLPLIISDLTGFVDQPLLKHAYLIFFKLDLFGIYEYLECGNIANVGSKKELPRLRDEIEKMISTLQDNNLNVLMEKTICFHEEVINYFDAEDRNFRPLVEKYFAKQVICSLDARGMEIPDGLRAVFFQKDFSKKVRVKVYVLEPWINELPISYLHDVFVNSKGELVVSFYQEYSKTHAFLVYFTFFNLSNRHKIYFKEKVFTKKWFSGYVEKFKSNF